MNRKYLLKALDILEQDRSAHIVAIDELESILMTEAIAFATKAHEGQKRKYSDDDYIVHPIAVMRIVETVPHTFRMKLAALFHDVAEDTKVTLKDIEQEWDKEVADLVEMLTDNSTPEDGNRRARKAKDLIHTSKASPQGKTIKLADLIHNTGSIVAHDKDFARVYLKEKEKLLEVLKEGNKTLYDKAFKILQNSQLILVQDKLNRMDNE
jgi:(p)ppGpp synthase/HD superfamily hydrolase